MKETPIVKIPEAWTALVDKRVSILPGSSPISGEAIVRSSDDAKSYVVKWRDDGKVFTSTDSATYWQGYAGYPVIAVMMLLDKLPYDKVLAQQFAGVEWKKLNTKFRNNYIKALEYVENERKINSDAVKVASEKVLEALYALDITIKRKL